MQGAGRTALELSDTLNCDRARLRSRPVPHNHSGDACGHPCARRLGEGRLGGRAENTTARRADQERDAFDRRAAEADNVQRPNLAKNQRISV